MSRDMKRRHVPGRKGAAGGTLVGLFIGLVLGIVGAAAVVWYVNKMPAPFKQPPAPPSATKPEAGNGAKPGDAGPIVLPGKPGDPVPEKRFQFYDILPGKSEAKVETPPPAETEKEKAAGKETIYLQAGSFQTAGDADNQKAKLALLGMEAGIQQVMVQDKVWFRVRLGPFAKVDDVNRVRAELARQGIEATVVKKD